MIASSEDALVCDMAETYGVLDYRALPRPLAATLAAGLRDTSRSKMKLSGAHAAPDTLLLAAATDWLATLVWMQSEDGRKHRNRPKAVLAALLGGQPKPGGEVCAFDTAEEYEAERARLLKEVKESGNGTG